ncbi:MAG: N-acyl-D-amino-acid deacylase family protein [Acidimicrobiales bacterium]
MSADASADASADVVVRGGTVVDGTGAAPRTADVHVAGGRIVAVGRVDAPAGARVIDADGALVLPGWVDIHAHYDGQATWDATLAPSSWQGVTTVVMSNCGVGFAPVHPEHHGRLVELMEGVEDIPGTALHEGLPWTWESFAEYLDALDFPHDIDLAAQAPHSAIRLFAMGERGSVHTEEPTAAEVGAMAALVRDAIAAGALGFSTSRTRNHRASTGEYIPSLTATPAELIGIAEGFGAAGAGVLQVVSDFFDAPSEFDLLEAMARAAGRPLSFSLAQNSIQPDTWRELLRRTEAANAAGLTVRAQVATRAIGLVLGFECTLNPFSLNPEYRRLAAKLPFAERIAALADPAVRERILAVHEPAKGRSFTRFDLIYRFDAVPDYEPGPADSVAAVAAAAGVDPAAWCYDHLLAAGGRTMLYHPSLNWAGGDLDAVGEMLSHPYTVPGLGDGGAHVGTICDGSFPTFLLTHWVRDRTHGRLELADVVRRQCRETARTVGLTDRGALLPGLRADVNVVDLDALTIHRPEFAYDLPAGGKRLLQKATGYRHTFVAGVETYRDGEHTGALAGRLVRGGH